MKVKGKNIAKASELQPEGEFKPFFADGDGEGPRHRTKASQDVYNRSVDKHITGPEAAIYPNINKTRTPYSVEGNFLNIRETVELCRKAYYKFYLLRNVIDVMCEFTVGEINLRGGNKQSRDFFAAWLKKINDWDLQDQFFREAYRSANIPIYRFDAEFGQAEITKIKQVYGANTLKKEVPIRYVILDPATINISQGSSFILPDFFKVLNAYEIQALKNPKTDEAKELRDSLPPEARKQIDKGLSTYIPLDKEKFKMVFYKKQPYEPFSLPFIYSVLDLIEWKLTLIAMDKALTKAADWIILHFRIGDEKTGKINPETLGNMRALFENNAIRRTLTTPYDVVGDWLVPDISKILGPEKYQEVNKALLQGLNAGIFEIGEAFANKSMTVELFIERTKTVREMFLREFLNPEIKRISKNLGFKLYPEAFFQPVNERDESVYARIYAQLAQIGVLTAPEAIKAIDKGILPTKEEMEENQAEYKRQRDNDFFKPLVGGEKEQPTEGRPPGATAPKSKTTVKPIGTKAYDIHLVTDNLNNSLNLIDNITDRVKKEYKVKDLNSEQIGMVKDLALAIMVNETGNWIKAVPSYLKNPKMPNITTATEIEEIAMQLGLDTHMASILYLSRKKE